jgi:hypothetical protein
MKQLASLMACITISVVIAGCRGSGVNVVIEGGGRFPPALAGKWRNEESGWEFVFKPNGTISSAIIDLALMPVEPAKGIARKPMKVGYALFKLGRWTVQYNPQARDLAVEAVVDFLHVDIGPTWLEGNLTTWFAGPVSQDYKTWKAQRISFSDYIAYTPEPHELPLDPNDTITELLFEKVADGNDLSP